MDKLYMSILDTLESSTREHDGQQGVDSVIVSALDTVRAAVADFAQSWNRNHADLLQRFPLELRVSCLKWLEPDDVLAASHVSRDWRSTSLSEPILWDTFSLHLSELNIDTVGDCVGAMLQRSRSVPFDFSWACAVRMSARIMTLLLEHAARLRHVVVFNQSRAFISNMLDRPMPYLRTFKAADLDGPPVKISRTWNDTTVPHLRSLTLPGILIPVGTPPLPSVTSLTLQQTTNCRHLFETFPNLQTVDLRGVISSTLLPLEFSRSLVSFRIKGIAYEDHSMFLLSSGWRRLREMHLHSLSVARTVQWFANNPAREWELSLRCPSSRIIIMKMEDDEQHTLHVTLPYDRFIVEPFASLAIHLSELVSLTLEEPDRVIRCTYGLTLPVLRSFTICLNHGRERSRDWLTPTANVLSAPALQLLSFQALQLLSFQYAQHHTVDRSRAMSIIRHVPSIVTTGEHRFQTLQLIGHGASVLCNQALFAWSFCEEIKLEDIAPDSTQRATYVISPTRSRRV